MELVTAVFALGRICTFSGVNAHLVWSGIPEHESVTNIGAVSDCGVDRINGSDHRSGLALYLAKAWSELW
jgi:hypothetical protein